MELNQEQCLPYTSILNQPSKRDSFREQLQQYANRRPGSPYQISSSGYA